MSILGELAGAFIGGLGSFGASREAGRSAERAAETSAEAQMAGLEYLKEQEKLPIYYRDQALGLLADEFGLTPYGVDAGGTTYSQERNPEYDEIASALEAMERRRGGASQVNINRNIAALRDQLEGTPEYLETTIDQSGQQPSSIGVTDIARSSPLYEAMLSARGAGEESIARNAAVSGRLRGGATINDLARYNTDLDNQALLTSYQNVMGGLSSMAGAQGYAPQIAQQYSNIGETRAAGQLGSAQAMQQGYAGIANALGAGAEAYFNRDKGTV